jgi:Uma2 family endonuclease
MATLIQDPDLAERLIAERQQKGHDVYDEVWEGVYVMAPSPNDEHQKIALRIAHALVELIEIPGLGEVRTTINLAADPDNWEYDYRVPDVVVMLHDLKGRFHNTFWTGPADFVVEVASPYDDTRKKIPFYQQLKVRELLIVDRNPWKLELYRFDKGKLALVSSAGPDQPAIACNVVALRLSLRGAGDRPDVVVEHTLSDRKWAF